MERETLARLPKGHDLRNQVARQIQRARRTEGQEDCYPLERNGQKYEQSLGGLDAST